MARFDKPSRQLIAILRDLHADGALNNDTLSECEALVKEAQHASLKKSDSTAARGKLVEVLATALGIPTRS